MQSRDQILESSLALETHACHNRGGAISGLSFGFDFGAMDSMSTRRLFGTMRSSIASLIVVSALFATTSLARAVDDGSVPRASNLEESPAPSRDLVRLGRRLFKDPRLSAEGTISCATCHIPERAFADGRSTARGRKGLPGTRNT